MKDIPASICFTQAQRKAIADILPKLADRLKLDEKNSRTVSFILDELQTIHRKAEQAIPEADTGMKRNSLRHIADAATKAIEDSQGIGSIPKSERLYQFKITLNDSEPTIWRRIQVKNCTLDKLHERIQTAMGWTNSHLHEFDIGGERYGDPELLDYGYEDFDCVDTTVAKIRQIVPKDGKRFDFIYQYDFGDCWTHEVLLKAVSVPNQDSGIPCASKANGPAHQRMSAASEDTPSISKRWPTPITSGIKSSWRGEENSIQRRSTLRKPPRR